MQPSSPFAVICHVAAYMHDVVLFFFFPACSVAWVILLIMVAWSWVVHCATEARKAYSSMHGNDVVRNKNSNIGIPNCCYFSEDGYKYVHLVRALVDLVPLVLASRQSIMPTTYNPEEESSLLFYM